MSSVLEASERTAVEHDRTAFNLAVWDKIVANPEFARMPYRFETDEHGQIIMSPPPAPSHGNKQSEISYWLRRLSPKGRVITECPISTRKGVKSADVAWCSPDVWQESEGKSCLLRSPEICVEVISPSNTSSEIEEKKQLYFDAGAKEVWLCSENGMMSFFVAGKSVGASEMIPAFPTQIE
ncbi:Uma2 family endonuclease [Luteolibacter flavescens]|uniref:Uma2 family endonuclease n=1 Tax=Luteolibacter flavescens TaxID=1859460 RepID=A0ABT3FVJ9_9BACT|nr:Uma2 family endonuclease [Luteolibacter flavescens]MCW1887604.1 Uma2 family endonuclease [Luteolibacter flavescens]